MRELGLDACMIETEKWIISNPKYSIQKFGVMRGYLKE